MNVDRADNCFHEVALQGCDDKVRVTRIRESWDGGPALRIQIRQAGGRVLLGPEIPLTALPGVMAAMTELLIEGSQ